MYGEFCFMHNTCVHINSVPKDTKSLLNDAAQVKTNLSEKRCLEKYQPLDIQENFKEIAKYPKIIKDF